MAAIGQALAEVPTLVVFDNFESVLPDGDAPLPAHALQAVLDAAAAWFATLGGAAGTRGSRLLVTTRDPALPPPRVPARPRPACTASCPGSTPTMRWSFAGAILADRSLPRPAATALEPADGLPGQSPPVDPAGAAAPGRPEIRAAAGRRGRTLDEGQAAVDAIIAEFDELAARLLAGAGTERNQSLEVSLRFSLRRLGAGRRGPAAAAGRVPGRRDGEHVLLAVTEIDAAAWAGLKPALAERGAGAARGAARREPCPTSTSTRPSRPTWPASWTTRGGPAWRSATGRSTIELRRLPLPCRQQDPHPGPQPRRPRAAQPAPRPAPGPRGRRPGRGGGLRRQHQPVPGRLRPLAGAG